MDRSRLAIWAGIEPSVVRIGDRYVDQVRSTGHHDRLSDLDLLAGLGIEALRYPVLWERVAPDSIASAQWEWSDQRLARIRDLGIEPIVTLLHHGSGPRYTDLLDPQFPEKLAAYARAVARRYPWLKFFTPVNEPLTTARFSTLYGHWYPHARDTAAFVTALLNQVRGIARAMDAIRQEIPGATLVQTEDLGKTYATEHLRYQADFENERRWTSIDLLCGVFEQNVQMRTWLQRAGLDLRNSDLRFYECEPGILGFNYYVTGERFLDHRLERYRTVGAGGNGRDRYVDVEAVRVCKEGIDGTVGLLGEAWERYRRPLAITEAHLACTREEQIRWLDEIYADLVQLRDRGADVRALTVWATFGACDWNSLLTRCDGYYESGCFDASEAPPRETLVAAWTRARAAGEKFHHPVTDGAGWWRLPARLQHGAATRGAAAPTRDRRTSRARIAIAGDTPIARRCAALCAQRSLGTVAIVADDGSVRRLAHTLRSLQPWVLIDAQPGAGMVVARAAGLAGVPLVMLSTASGSAFDRREAAGVLATGKPFIARFHEGLDLDRWLHRVLDLAIDGVTGMWWERGGSGGSIAS